MFYKFWVNLNSETYENSYLMFTLHTILWQLHDHYTWLLKIVMEECSCCVQTLIRYKMQFPLMSASRMILVNYSGLLPVVYFSKHHSHHNSMEQSHCV